MQPQKQPVLQIYTDKSSLAEGFCRFLAEDVRASLNQPGFYSIALSGGSTPGIVFDLLAARYANAIDWQRVLLFWGDERCVPWEDPESNYGNARQRLISRIPIPAGNIFPVCGACDPEEEALRYGQLLRTRLPQAQDPPCLNLVLLGLGEDGHTASIFPHEKHLLDSDQLCAVATKPGSSQKRITLTGKTIRKARKIIFLVSGTGKEKVLREIVRNEPSALNYPAGIISRLSQVSVFCDHDAAGKLT